MSAPAGGGRRGFTLVEVLVVVVVLSIVVRIAMPNIQEALLRARAAEALGDLRVVEVAARQYNADTGTWPSESSPGQVPDELTPYLPEDFGFTFPEYELDWEIWALPEGLPSDPGASTLVGVSLVTEREELGLAVAQLLGPNGWYSLGNHYTRLLEST